MIEFYPQIKQFHVALALLSGLLFAMRGGFAIAGARWPLAAPLRFFSYAVDTALLTAAMMLLTILPGTVFANGWLWVKLGLLFSYIVLGVLALREARAPGVRWICYLAALLFYGAIYLTARTHQPMGALHSLWSWLR